MSKKASDFIADFLESKKIKHVFGIVGAGNAHIFDSIYSKGYTEIVCVHHEQAACMAMQTYYRTSGTITASILTTGGGATNGVTGVVSAWMDSIPGLIIAGNENSKYTQPDNPLRIWGVQGYNSTAMVEKVTKYTSRVMDPAQVCFELEKAYHIAGEGRPGPCWVEIPMNIQSALVEPSQMASFVRKKSDDLPAPTDSQVNLILEKIKTAKRPVFWLGHGIRLAGAVGQISTLLEKLQIPTLVSWAGIDMVDSDHPLVFGRAGTYGQRAANFVLQNSDFVLAIGTRLAIPQIGYDLTELARSAEIACVDIDLLEANKLSSRVKYPVQCDAGIFIKALLEVNSGKTVSKKEWLDQCNVYKKRYPWIGPEHKDEGGFINSYPFMERLERHFKPKQIVVTDMGTALLSGHQVLKFKSGQRLMTSTGLGEMGYGLPAAMGASFATQQGEVLCLNCDGGMMMNLQELQTIVHHQLPIKIVVFNNDGYLMIKHTQKSLFKGRYSGTDKKSGVSCPDFSAVAKAFGIPSFRIRSWEDFDQVIPQVQEAVGPVICEVFMHPEQYFYPKLSLAVKSDGTLVSPPLEDLSPLLPRDELRQNMIVGMHPKSEQL